jgi:hypothetical protein
MEKQVVKPKARKRKKYVQNKDTSGSVSPNNIQIAMTLTTDTPIRKKTQDSSEIEIGTISTSHALHDNPKHS